MFRGNVVVVFMSSGLTTVILPGGLLGLGGLAGYPEWGLLAAALCVLLLFVASARTSVSMRDGQLRIQNWIRAYDVPRGSKMTTRNYRPSIRPLPVAAIRVGGRDVPVQATLSFSASRGQAVEDQLRQALQ